MRPGKRRKPPRKQGELIREARTLLADVDVFAPNIPRPPRYIPLLVLESVKRYLQPCGHLAVCIIRDHNLFLIEYGLHIYLGHGDKPMEGYCLAANYCENYDPRYGNSLNGPSRRRSKR
jgi:hypothetical protein